VTQNLSLFVAGTLDHMMDTRADTRMVTNSTNAPAGETADAAGFGFTAFSITGGLEGHF
jgi:outer membrane protease